MSIINGQNIEAIIQSELANHECQITMDYTTALKALERYNVTEQQVRDQYGIFFQRCIDQDLF